MKVGFYPKIAWDGIRKNKRLYFPYILTGIVMVMMYYILSFLMESPAINQMKGGSIIEQVLPLGCVVIAVFSLIFLFYTNSFLIKQRYREFGLYNILGMDKFNISRVMVWETLFAALIAIIIGLISGIALSKASELVLLNLLHMEITFTLSIGSASLRNTALIYAGIYFILLLNSIIKVIRSKPLELMQSSKVGEKRLKCNWLFAIIGVIILGAAYFLAVSIKEPVTALAVFMVAVIMVIIGTYLIFVSGLVAFCKLLQKNKKYYYKPNHFVSVSSMAYRMKRNGAGLASICILLTMVLVMISSTTVLYFGEEDSIMNAYPNGINIKVWFNSIEGISDDNLNELRNDISEYSGKDADLSGTRTCAIPGMFTDDGMIVDYTHADWVNYDKVGYLYVVSLEDYNRNNKANATLADDECLIYCDRMTTRWNTFTMEYGNTYKVKERLTQYATDSDASMMTMPSVYIIVKDLYSFAEPVAQMYADGRLMMQYTWACGFDVAETEDEIAVNNQIFGAIRDHFDDSYIASRYSVQSREFARQDFFDMYGSLFFLGIMLSIVFLFAAVLIIYYKQISEGYEDQNRFEIMQKVGMTKKDIKKSINSQMLTVFFMPLITAGIHLAFAYPVISKILLLFSFDNALLNISVNLICFVIFGLFYAVVYKITSGSYYSIVSGRKE